MRDLTDEFSTNIKCSTIKEFSDNSCEFSGVCHHHTRSQLGPGKAALGRFPCDCEACDHAITQPWVNGIEFSQTAVISECKRLIIQDIVQRQKQAAFCGAA